MGGCHSGTQLSGLPRKCDLSIRDVQECARKVGVPAQKGAAQVSPSQVEKMRPALEAMRRRNQWLRNERASVSVELADHRPDRVPGDTVYVECSCCQIRLNCRET